MINFAPSLSSSLLIALETVALDSLSSDEASPKDRHSATFAKTASPSKSGSLDMIHLLETIGFDSFYFKAHRLSISLVVAAKTCLAISAGQPAAIEEGTLTHRDSLGNEGRVEAGHVQIVSAETGIRHAEYNLERKTAPGWSVQPCPNREGIEGFVAMASGFDVDRDALP